MPRQPFLPTFAHLNYVVGPTVLDRRPELAAALGRCIATWGHSDNEMGVLLGVLLGTESQAAMEVFLTIRKSSKQREVLRAASKYKLTGNELLFFEAMMRIYRSLEKQRNDLAHGCFGIAENDPDALLWINIKEHVHFQTEAVTYYYAGIQMPDQHKKLKENMYVYRLKDLNNLQNEMEQFREAALFFNVYLRDMSHKGHASQFARIQNLPLIKSALDASSQFGRQYVPKNQQGC